MKTPDRIYISPSIRTEIAYYSRILIGNPKFNICPRYGNEIEYIRADIHEAEINALKAEVAALKAPPKVLSAEEVKEPGCYWWRREENTDWSVQNVYLPGAGKLLVGQFIGPIKMREV